MATYCWTCPECRVTYTTTVYNQAVSCGMHPGYAIPCRRDYRAENVGVHTAELKREREGGDKARSLMLPSNRDFAGPGDPDGHSGLRQWREEFQPKADNKRPKWPGDLPKKSF